MSTVSLPYVCCELDPVIPARTREIHHKLKAGTRESQAEPAAETLGLAINTLVDSFLTQLLRELAAAHPEHALYQDALKVVEDIQGKVQHYLGWLTRFLSNERMTVVAAKYLEMIQPLVATQPQREFLAVSIEPVLAAHARKTIAALRSGESVDVRAGIEVLISIVDAVLVDFVNEPKRLMRFNLIVDKTLDGAIYMIKGLAFRQLRALGERLPVAHLPVFLDHLEHFFHDQSPVQ